MKAKEKWEIKKKNMRKALNKYYYNMRKNSLKTAYTLMLKESYCNEEGKLVEENPSYHQFRYFYRSYNLQLVESIAMRVPWGAVINVVKAMLAGLFLRSWSW